MENLSSKDFWMSRKANPYGDLQDPSLHNCPFWARKQLSVYHDILKDRENLYVANVKSMDVEYLQQNVGYFGTALQLCEKLGILNIMQFNKDFDPDIVVVFFATVHLGTDEDMTFTWMTNGRLLSAPWKSFMNLLGYDDQGLQNPLGFCPHRETTSTHK
ncbi:hypothetical protein D1007_22432 [Hordeum vulgare]|nr:hypothetical protein D1007_22432 [Hordeum vulgare]